MPDADIGCSSNTLYCRKCAVLCVEVGERESLRPNQASAAFCRAAQKPHRNNLTSTRAPQAAPSRNPSPLYPPCLQLVPLAPLSGLVLPAPPLPRASLRPEATLPPLPPRRVPPTSRLWPSSASTEPTRVPWYDFHDFNWRHSDDGRMMAGQWLGKSTANNCGSTPRPPRPTLSTLPASRSAASRAYSRRTPSLLRSSTPLRCPSRISSRSSRSSRSTLATPIRRASSRTSSTPSLRTTGWVC
jgi:hypothetical protein